LQVSGNSGSSLDFGSFTVTEAVFDYSGPSPTIVSLSISFELHANYGTQIFGIANYNYAPAGPAILDTIMESNTQLIANRSALAERWKKTKLENIALLLRAAIEAHGRVGLMLNVRRADLDKILALLPALQRPTISSLSDQDWVAVNTIIEERTVRDLIPKVKAAGGQGIVEYPLNKIVI